MSYILISLKQNENHFSYHLGQGSKQAEVYVFFGFFLIHTPFTLHIDLKPSPLAGECENCSFPSAVSLNKKAPDPH